MTVPVAPRPKPPKAADIKAGYGFVALLAKSVPELNSLLNKAISGQWTADRFTQEVANSKWWKSTADTDRQWLMERITDPATAQRDLKAGADQMRAEASKLGLGMDFSGTGQGHWEQIWLQSRLKKVSGDALDAFLAQSLMGAQDATHPAAASGAYGKMISDAYNLAYQYGYAPTDLQKQILDYAYTGMRTGAPDAAAEGFKNKMIQYASTKYMPFAEQIKGGATVKDIAQPYIDSWSQTLELDPAAVSLADQTVQKWLQGQPGSDGKAVPPTVSDVQKQARQDARWQYTDNSKQAVAQTATVIGKAFGMIG